MTETAEARTAGLILRLLTGDPRVDPEAFDWSLVGAIARRDRVAQRVAATLERRGARLPPRFRDAVRRERARADGIVALVARIGATCARCNIPHVLLKFAQHYPDVGRDVDLLVPHDAHADVVLLDHVPALPGSRSARRWVDGRAVYPVPQHQTEIDVHHGRLGRLGEHARLAEMVLRRREPMSVGGATVSVPSLEDQMLLQALAQASGRLALRLADVLWMITVLRGRRLDWDVVLAAARATALYDALACRLQYVEQVHQEVFERPLLSPALREKLDGRDWGQVTYRDGAYRFAVARVSGRLYLKQLQADVAAGDWEAAGRLCLLPVIAVSAGLRRISGPRRRITDE